MSPWGKKGEQQDLSLFSPFLSAQSSPQGVMDFNIIIFSLIVGVVSLGSWALWSCYFSQRKNSVNLADRRRSLQAANVRLEGELEALRFANLELERLASPIEEATMILLSLCHGLDMDEETSVSLRRAIDLLAAGNIFTPELEAIERKQFDAETKVPLSFPSSFSFFRSIAIIPAVVVVLASLRGGSQKAKRHPHEENQAVRIEPAKPRGNGARGPPEPPGRMEFRHFSGREDVPGDYPEHCYGEALGGRRTC